MPRWKDGSRGMLTVNAIFAGFSGVLLVNLVLHDLEKRSWFAYFSIILAGVALWLFAFAAERITDALDEGDPKTYLRSMQMYNVGVILVALSIALFIWEHVGLLIAALIVLSTIPWLRDAAYLLSPQKRDEYLQVIMQADRAA